MSSSWYSYLASFAVPLPSFLIPAQIQNRLLSFFIRRSIGHLLKRGGVEVDKLDAQVGKGWVEVREVELDEDAINALLPGLPLQLTSSHLASLSLSLPNLLTSPISLSISGLYLSFTLHPISRTEPDLTKSVHELVGEVMGDEEGEELRRDLQASFMGGAPSVTSDNTIMPGASPPFSSFEPPGSINPFLMDAESFASYATAPEASTVSDPPALSLLTTMLSRLVSRFTLKLADVTLRVLDPKEQCEWVLTLTEGGYEGVEKELEGEAGGRLWLDDLRVLVEWTKKDIESAEALLERSIDMEESMYASAMDTFASTMTSVPPSTPEEPLSIPLLHLPSLEAHLSTSLAPATPTSPPKTSISIDLPDVRTLITPRSLRAALSASDQLTPPASIIIPPEVPPSPTAPVLQTSFLLRSLNLFILPTPFSSSDLSSFFTPTSFPPSTTTHLYLLATSLQTTYTTSLSLGPSLPSSPQTPQSYGSPSSAREMRRASYSSTRRSYQRQVKVPKRAVEVTLGDLSIRWQPSSGSGDNQSTYDILAFSPALSDPYPSSKSIFPSFTPSPWTVSDQRALAEPVLRVRHDFSSFQEGNGDGVGDVTTVDLSAVDVKLGMEVVQELLLFKPVLQRPQAEEEKPIKSPPKMDVKPKKSVKIKRAVIDDLEDEPEELPPLPAFVLTIAFIRLSLRPPLCPDNAELRSGVFIADMHSFRFVSGDEESESRSLYGKRERKHTKAFVECQRLVASFWGAGDAKATAFLSIAPLLPISSSPMDHGSPLLPRLSVLSPIRSTKSAPALEVDANIPDAQVQLAKKPLDGLELWADDLGKWAAGLTPVSTMPMEQKLPTSDVSGGAMAARVLVSEVSVKLLIPRGGTETRPLELTLSDVDVLAEMKSGEKHEMVLNVSAMDVGMTDVTAKGVTTLLAQTTSRSLTTASKPILQLQLISATNADTGFKQNTVKITTYGFTLSIPPDLSFVEDLGRFFQAPPGAFEDAVPTEKAIIAAQILSGSVHVIPPNYAGAAVLAIGDLNLSTALIDNAPSSSADISARGLHFLLVDDVVAAKKAMKEKEERGASQPGAEYWKREGYATVLEVGELETTIRTGKEDARPQVDVTVGRVILAMHACADTLAALGDFVSDMATLNTKPKPPPQLHPNAIKPAEPKQPKSKSLLSSVEEDTFRTAPEIGSTPDMVNDDVPTNFDYLGTSFPPRKGFKVLDPTEDDDFDEIESPVEMTSSHLQADIISNVGGETIKILHPHGVRVIENHFNVAMANRLARPSVELWDSRFRVRIRDCDAAFNMHDGFDWVRTRKAIEDESKAVRRRLAKIRQLLAEGQMPDGSVEDAGVTLFNSIYIGLPPEADELEPGALIAAIDDELNDINDNDTASQSSSWQSMPQRSARPRQQSARVRGKKLTRSKGSRIQFCLSGLALEFDQMGPVDPLATCILVTVRKFEILDHIKSSTWKKFLTEMRTDLRGNIRETDANMVRVELRQVRPVPSIPKEEARLKAKLLPLKLHIDQDALDFIKRFFSFQAPRTATASTPSEPSEEAFIQHAEVFPIDITLDYKPKRVDFKALREGRTIEMMNFFHWDAAQITLRHITLSGVTGWARLGDMLNDLWTPDVKAHQLADVLSGVAPIRSVVNVGTGVADLILLPIAQYRKDQRVVRGVQRGAAAFMKSTAMEALKVGAQLATGTQVILEQAEHVLGGDFRDAITTGTVQDSRMLDSQESTSDDGESADPISKYANQPENMREGLRAGYRSLSTNINSAAQTILAVPMEVYERSNNEGPVRAVIRAVPIAVLKPMIGASEAVSKTLFGIRNSLDPNKRLENDEKYKRR